MTTRLTGRAAATAEAAAVIGGTLALGAPSAGATTTSGAVSAWGSNTLGRRTSRPPLNSYNASDAVRIFTLAP